MLVSNIFLDEDSQSFETPRNNYSANAPGGQILLGCYDTKFFETPRINNHVFIALSAHILLGDDDA